MAVLTIAVPTYNRPDQLSKCLEGLIAAGVSELPVTVVIHDNHSDVPASESIKSSTRLSLGSSLHVVRNVSNIGIGANIMQCMTQVDSEWLWVLSDDDPPTSQSLSSIFQEIRNSREGVAYINFAAPGVHRTGRTTTASFSDFLGRCTPLWPYTLLSSSIYNHRHCKNFLQEGYRGVYSLYPHFGVLLMSMAAGYEAVHSNLQIIRFSEDAMFSWSRLEADLCVMTLAELPLGWANKLAVYKLLRATTPGPRAFVGRLLDQKITPAERALLLNQYIQRRFSDMPLRAAGFGLFFRAYLQIMAITRNEKK